MRGQSYFRFGQMNEPPGARARVALQVCLSLNISVMEQETDQVKMYYSSLIISSVLQAGSEVSAL
jgi:F0F1-type ATP synthase beta subunit